MPFFKQTKITLNLFSILIAILFFGSFLSLPIFSQTAQNPIKLAIIAVDRNGQRSATRTINANEFSFDEVLKNNDTIRYQWDGIDLDLRYKNTPASGGGYLQVYKGTISEENFILDAGRENYPLKIQDLSKKLEPGSNRLLFVYKNSGSGRTYAPVTFTFNYQPDVLPPSLKIVKPAAKTVFGKDLENTVVVEMQNFSLSSNSENKEATGKMRVYYNQISENTLLGTVTKSENAGQNKFQTTITPDQIDFSKIPDSQESKLIFVLTNSKEEPIGVQQEFQIKTNFNNSIDTGLPQIKILEPKKDRSDLTVTPDTKFILQIQNFNLLEEAATNSENDNINNNEGYLQIYINDGSFTIPLQTIWSKAEFTLREVGYISEPEEDSQKPADDLSGNKKIKVQLVNTDFEFLQPEAFDEIDIFYNPEIADLENEEVVENNIWRLVMIAFTVILIVGVIVVLIIKG